MITFYRYHSPVGTLILGASPNSLYLCDWTTSHKHHHNLLKITRQLGDGWCVGKTDIIQSALFQLDNYFCGKSKDFNLHLQLFGTSFQKTVWQALQKIPYGTTISYSELSRRIGRPSSVRAVASAVACNPISVIVPCHRVVGSNGHTGGYAGGLKAKEMLLCHELSVSFQNGEFPGIF